MRLLPRAWFEQHYSRGIYPKIASILVPFGDIFPFSLSFLLILVIAILFVVYMVFTWKRRKSIFTWLLWTIDNLFAFAMLAYILFFTLWGANYLRLSVEEQFNLALFEVTEADLEAFVDRLEPILINPPPNRDQSAALNSIYKSLKATVFDLTGVEPSLPRIKKLFPGSLIRFGNSSGVTSPFLLEAHVDSALSDTFSIRVAVHELAHVAGYAGEADAELISAIAALNSDNDFARYSVALDIYISAINQLAKESRANHYEKLPITVKEDIKAIYLPFEKYASPLWYKNLQMIIYGQYLKTQGVSAGLADYSRDIKLLVIADKQALVFRE